MNIWNAENWRCRPPRPPKPRPCREEWEMPCCENPEYSFKVLGMDCNGNWIVSVHKKRVCIVNDCPTSCTRYY
ncbi:MAG: hypothetical protein E7335_03950 [Clostridiales bacterium]|nr:hypothetical protein [Clostridiales bacterium]